MNVVLRQRRSWLVPLAIIALLVGLLLTQPAVGRDDLEYNCSGSTYIADFSVGVYTDEELANNRSFYGKLSEAVEDAVKVQKICASFRPIMIRVQPGTVRQYLPHIIGDESRGTIFIKGEQGSPDIVDDPTGEVIINTELFLDNLSFRVGTNGYLRPNSSVTIHNSTFNSFDGTAIAIRLDGTDQEYKSIFIRGSKFVNIGVVDARSSKATFGMTASTIVRDDGHSDPFITMASNGKVYNHSFINGNTFRFDGRSLSGPMIVIRRPVVEFIGNSFISSSPHHVTAIQLEPQVRSTDHLPAKYYFVSVQQNDFNVTRSIGDKAPPDGFKEELDQIWIRYNNFAKADETLPKADTYMNHTFTFAPCNYWGDLSKREDVKANRRSMDTYLPKPVPLEEYADDSMCVSDAPKPPPPGPGPSTPPSPSPSTGPSPSPSPTGEPTPAAVVDRIHGITRVETAVEAAQNLFAEPTDGVIIARADVFADSVSAVPLSKGLKVPVLLTQSDKLHPATAKELKRLMPKGGTAYIMGGPVAIHPSAEDEIKAIVGKTERLAGENRAETAVKTGEKLKALGRLKSLIFADGTDWQPSLVAGPVAAKQRGTVLLTWGEQAGKETNGFWDANKLMLHYAIGAAAAKLDPKMVSVNETDPAAMSFEAAKTFFGEPKAIGIATTEEFADALSGGAHIANLDGPIILIGKTTPPELLKWIKDTKSISRLVVYGGEERISADQEADLRTALKH